MLILMYKDIITELKISGLYIIMNSKNEDWYNLVLESIYRLLSNNNQLNLEVKTFVTNQEQALINNIKNFFPKIQRISCLFHYKQDILRNMRIYGLLKKNMKTKSMELLRELVKIPFQYKRDINYINNRCDELSQTYKYHTNIINNYFLKKQKSLFLR